MGLVQGKKILNVLAWTVIAFLSGSIPFSVFVGRLAANVDIRYYGDHNPGATNVLRATNRRWFTLAGLLDYLKGAVPVGIAWFFLGIDGWAIIPVALAPILGHAYSPWLRFQGGKAVAVTFGVWTGLTLGTGPIIFGMLLTLMFVVFESSAWAVMLAMLSFGGFVWLQYGNYQPELMGVWVGNLAILTSKHWAELKQPPAIQPWVLRLIGRGS